jgi:hypothetical protein
MRVRHDPETGPAGPWIDLDGTKFPLVRDKEGRGQIQFRPMTQFAPASQIGPPNRPPSDPRFLVATFADLSRGAGTQRHEEIDGLNSYRSGTFDSRNKQGLGMPPLVETLADTLDLAGLGFTDDLLPGEGTTRAFVVRAGQNAFLYVSTHDSPAAYFAYDLIDDIATYEAARRLTAVAPFGSLVFGAFSDTEGIKRTDTWASAGGDPTIDNAVTGTNYVGMVEFDNKLWSFNTSDNMLYAAIDPDDSGSWTAISSANNIAVGPKQLLVGRDVRGEPAIFLLSEDGAWGLDQDPDPAEWRRFIPAAEWGYRRATVSGALRYFTTPVGTVWRKDNNLYIVYPDAKDEFALHVVQWNGTARDVGPLQSGEFDIESRFERILKVEGNTHYLYAFGAAGDTGLADEVLCMSDTGGWHTLWVNPDTATNPMVTGVVDGGDIYVVLADGTIKVIRDRDNGNAPHVRYPSGGGHTQDEAEIYSGWLDWGLPNHYKIAKHVFISASDREGGLALPTGNQLQFRYRYDDTSWSSALNIDPADNMPVRVALPSLTSQIGVGCRRFEYHIAAVQTGSAEPFLLEEVSVHGERWVEPFWSYQMAIDLRESTFRNFPEGKFDNNELHTLRAALEALCGVGAAAPAFHIPVAWGHGEWATSIESAELLFGGTYDPSRGDGIFQVTVRDVTMPHDSADII